MTKSRPLDQLLLTGLDKPMIALHEPFFDVRVLADNFKATMGIDEFSLMTLAQLIVASPSPRHIVSLLNQIRSRPAPPPANRKRAFSLAAKWWGRPTAHPVGDRPVRSTSELANRSAA